MRSERKSNVLRSVVSHSKAPTLAFLSFYILLILTRSLLIQSRNDFGIEFVWTWYVSYSNLFLIVLPLLIGFFGKSMIGPRTYFVGWFVVANYISYSMGWPAVVAAWESMC